MAMDVFLAQIINECNGLREGHHVSNVGRAGLKFIGEVVIRGFSKRHVLDHFATAHVRGHFFEPFLFSVEYAHPCGAVHFVGREAIEIGIKGHHIYGQVGCRLCPVNKHHGTMPVRQLDDLLHGIDGAQGVAGMVGGHHPGFVGKHIFVRPQIHFTAVVYGDDPKHCAFPFAKHLPGHNIAVVFQFGYDDLVPFADKRPVAGRHQVDAFGDAPRKNNFFPVLGAHKFLGRFAGGFVGLGGLFGQRMYAPVDVCIVPGIVFREFPYYPLWFLGRGGIVKIYQRLSVYFLLQYRKGRTDFLNVQLGGFGNAHASITFV